MTNEMKSECMPAEISGHIWLPAASEEGPGTPISGPLAFVPSQQRPLRHTAESDVRGTPGHD